MSTPDQHLDWHLDDDLALRYATGRVATTLGASIEQHLVRCADCRALLAPAVDDRRLEAVWNEVVEKVTAPRPGLLERALRRLGAGEATSRLVVATPSLRGSWLLGVVIVLTIAVLIAHVDDEGIAVFMGLAPVLPVVGVALAFGPVSDPSYEIVSATPHPPVHLLAVRTAVVTASTIVPALVAAPFVPGKAWLSVAWLLPALALTVGTLALATRIAAHVAAIALISAWVAVAVPAVVRTRDPWLAAHPAVQLISLAALLVAAGVLVLQRDQLSTIYRRTA